MDEQLVGAVGWWFESVATAKTIDRRMVLLPCNDLERWLLLAGTPRRCLCALLRPNQAAIPGLFGLPGNSNFSFEPRNFNAISTTLSLELPPLLPSHPESNSCVVFIHTQSPLPQ